MAAARQGDAQEREGCRHERSHGERSDMSELQEFLQLPDQVHKSDFVVKLTEGIAHPRELLPDYALTPEIVDCFDQALGLVGSALRGKQNYGAYVHGSFGSGKSHFLA